MRFHLASAAVLALSVTPAVAADPWIDVPSIEMATSRWEGPYVGAGFSYMQSTINSDNIWSLDLSGGFNGTVKEVIFGAEAYLSARYNADWYFAVGVQGRVGLLVADIVATYASLGVELDDGMNNYAIPGFGVEVMFDENMSLDLQYKHFIRFDNAWRAHAIFATLNWHF
jgi:opacity protein-like surface antigen